MESFKQYLVEGKKLVLYHGTSDIQAKKIKRTGMENTTSSPQWYMFSSHIDDAIFHSETVTGNPVAVEFHIPIEDVKGMWKGYPYLWPPFEAGKSGKFKGDWYAIKDTIPAKFMKKIIKISQEDLDRVNR